MLGTVVANRRNGLTLIEVIETNRGYVIHSNGNWVTTCKSMEAAIRFMVKLAGPEATGNDFYI